MRSIQASLVLVAALAAAACNIAGAQPGCGHQNHKTWASPDGQLELEAFYADCGATTPAVTHLALRRAGTHPARERWWSDPRRDLDIVLTHESWVELDPQWLDRGTVQVRGKTNGTTHGETRHKYGATLILVDDSTGSMPKPTS